MEGEAGYTNSSGKKPAGQSINGPPFDPNFSYCILQFDAVFAAISECVVCRKCGGDIKFIKYPDRELGFKLHIFCTICQENKNSVLSSPLIEAEYEVNRRFTFAMRLLGQGLAGMNLFRGMMDLPSCKVQGSFDDIMIDIGEAARVVANSSMKDAAKEELRKSLDQNRIELTNNGIVVFGDSTWMQSGPLLYGVTTLTGYFGGKVIDLFISYIHENFCDKNCYCGINTCKDRGGICPVNTEKTEADATVEMFKRSKEQNDVKYEYYVGDGDLEIMFSAITNSQPYDDLEVKKRSCLTHVQKRMDSRLRQLVIDYNKPKSLVRNDSIEKIVYDENCVVGKLTDKLIDQLTLDYEAVIGLNEDSLENMKKAIWATYYHKISTDDNPQHHYCHAGNYSWCDWIEAKDRGTIKNYKHEPALPEIVQKVIEPVYESMTNDDLLTTHLGVFSNKRDERLYAEILKIAPESPFNSHDIIEIATNVAVSKFNDGATSLLKILQLLGATIGHEAHKYCYQEDPIA